MLGFFRQPYATGLPAMEHVLVSSRPDVQRGFPTGCAKLEVHEGGPLLSPYSISRTVHVDGELSLIGGTAGRAFLLVQQTLTCQERSTIRYDTIRYDDT